MPEKGINDTKMFFALSFRKYYFKKKTETCTEKLPSLDYLQF